MFMPVDEVAEILGFHRSTIWRWVKAAKLKTKPAGDGGRKAIPFLALLNFLHKKGKFPLPSSHLERGAHQK